MRINNKYNIHKEGYKIILVTIALLLLMNIAANFIQSMSSFRVFFGIVSLMFFGFVVAFFRIPFRIFNQHNDQIIAPADGKVVVIEEVEEPEYFKDKRIQVSIFMSPTNVHVNRNPIAGEVKYVRYHPGKYLVAWHPKSSTKNERYTVVVGNDQVSILTRQIAGKLARRIVNYLKVGEDVEQCEEFGFIKFGSRVDLFLPLNTVIHTKLKDKVKGGVTIIGTIPQKN
ncbi:MAG: phosphatidylserine decarboxylase family protein [Chitinophagales bacterium]|nr:phosphatidylserine decarboxylase family protein [Chitinophagales bacterium]